MIGRAALGNPWLFRQIAHTLRTGDVLPEPTPRQRAQTALRHAQLAVQTSSQGERHVLYKAEVSLQSIIWACRGLLRCESNWFMSKP